MFTAACQIKTGPTRRWLPSVWLFLLIGLAAGGGRAAAGELTDSPFTIEAQGTEEGLPQSSVISVIQSRDGYLWLGTLKGLVRFDGLRFTVFNEFNTPLKSDQIVCLFEDSRTNLWVGMDSGDVALIHGGHVININLGGAGHDSRLTSACEDTHGAVWLYTHDSRLARYQDGVLEIQQLFPGQQPISRQVAADQTGSIWVSEYEPSVNGGKALLLSFRADNFHPPALAFDHTDNAQRIDAILASRRGGLWRLMDGRVQKCDGATNDFGPYPWASPQITAAAVTAVCEDQSGNLIVGTPGDGVYWFDASGSYRHLSKDDGLSSNFILSLCVDSEGDLWVGTDGDGLNRVKRRVFRSPAGLEPLSAQSVAGDASGGLWTAFNAHGVDYWKTNAVRHYPVGIGQNAWTVLVDHQQQVWVGTRGEGLQRLEGDVFQPALYIVPPACDVYALFEDHAGTIWAGTQDGLAKWDGRTRKIFRVPDGLPENRIRALAEDPAGALWIGTESRGLSVWRDGKFTNLPASENGPPGDDISALYIDRDGTLWVGTAGHGLGRMKNGQWTHYSTRNGLKSNSISYIVDDDGGLWIGSNAGLMRVPKSGIGAALSGVRTFGQADGLPTRECSIGSQPSACRTSDGRWWFPTEKGLVYLNPADLKPDNQPPLVRIESVEVDGQEQNTNSLDSNWTPSVIMPAASEQLEIHYAGLHFSAPREVRFRYQIADRGSKPTEAGGERVARYLKFWPGHYVFHVTACNEDGVWNETGATLDITVLPEFWQTRTFLIAMALVILGLVAGIVRYLSTQKLKREVALFKQQEALEKERSRIARDLHDQLGANLTQVSLLGEMAKADRDLPEEVESHADQILQTARETTHALDEIVWAVNPANDTLEGLVNYAVKYAQEYLALAGLRYRADVPAQFQDASIPPEVRHNVFLAFKESVNNVVKHAQATEVQIRLQVLPDKFIFEILDNGRGLAHLDPNRAKTRNGLRNMRKRLEEIHGEFSLTPREEGGTMVRLAAPLGRPPEKTGK